MFMPLKFENFSLKFSFYFSIPKVYGDAVGWASRPKHHRDPALTKRKPQPAATPQAQREKNHRATCGADAIKRQPAALRPEDTRQKQEWGAGGGSRFCSVCCSQPCTPTEGSSPATEADRGDRVRSYTFGLKTESLLE